MARPPPPPSHPHFWGRRRGAGGYGVGDRAAVAADGQPGKVLRHGPRGRTGA